ncbi:MAG: ATP-dependent zinc protease [Desulfuromonadaceae bacterium]|nr:ATP-dependent zinc protease [Desulfuromonadaceae bacterium]
MQNKRPVSAAEKNVEKLIYLGWREWLCLPELGIESLKAKIDTGARTSALHAFFVEPYVCAAGVNMVRFGIHPHQRNTSTEVICSLPVKDVRQVTDSGGHRELRHVVETQIELGNRIWRVEMTLTNRDNMKFRMLLGRTALQGMAVIPARSYLHGKKSVSKNLSS